MKFLLLLFALLLAVIPPVTHAMSLTQKYQINSPLAKDQQKRIFSTLFHVELWSRTFPAKYDQDMTIRITFASRFDNQNIIEFLTEEAAELHQLSKPQLSKMKHSLATSLTCNSKAGTVLDLNYVPGQGVIVSCNSITSSAPVADGPLSFYLLDVFLHADSEFENLNNH